MNIYTLYLKVHRKTGLRYLGQTSKADPINYKGSGIDWLEHLKTFGVDVETTILFRSHNRKSMTDYGRYLSRLWNVVGAMDDYGNKIWANRIPETGGGAPASEITRKKMKKAHIGENNGMYGKNHSDKVKTASSIRLAATNRARKWYNNGMESKFLTNCPEGWIPGRINQKAAHKGTRLYNNGSKMIMSKSSPGPEWVLGMLKK